MKVHSNVTLVGGGPGTLSSLRRHLRHAFSPHESPLVAYVGAASGDDAGFQRMIGVEIEAAGGRLRGVKLASPRAKVSAARALLEDADVVFVSGGDVEAGMNVLHERGVAPMFRELARAGKTMVGISAGSIMLGRSWVAFPGDETKGAPRVFPCLGVANVYVDAHAEEDGWAELQTLLRLLSHKKGRTVGFGLTKKGAIVVEGNGVRTRLTALGADAPRFVAHEAKVRSGEPLEQGRSLLIAHPRRRPGAR